MKSKQNTNKKFLKLKRFLSIIRPRLGRLLQHQPREIQLPSNYTKAIKLNVYPKISIVTPAFKQGNFIELTIKSVLDQKYPNLEYFVQDGASLDGTVGILERYSNCLAGWESKPDRGQSHAINRGFAKSTGEIMSWLNSDDILLPGALFHIADFFKRNPEVDVIYGHRIIIDENNKQIGRWVLPRHSDEVLSWVDFVPQETLFWRRSIWEKTGGYIDESFYFAMDWDLLMRFREAGARFVRLNRFIGAFRVYSQQKTSAAIDGVGKQEMDRIREHVVCKRPAVIRKYVTIYFYLFRHILLDIAYMVRKKTRLYI